MANAIAKVRREIVTYDQEFDIDPATEVILNVIDNKDEITVTVFILSYIRKGV